jgi:hypothetical protein
MKTKILVVAAILATSFVACQSEDELSTLSSLTDEQLKSTTIAVNDIAVESVAEEADFEANFYAEYEQLLRQLAHFRGRKGNLLDGKAGMHYLNNNPPAVSIDTAATGYPITITINYGDSTVTRNGRVMKGVVTIVLSAEKHTDGATRLVTFKDCSIDSIAIEGTCTETFNGDNTTTRKVSNSSDVTFTLADGTVIDRIGNHVREWLEGIDTQMERDDDKIQVTGSTKVTSSTGDVYSKEIIEPLIKLGECRHFVQGVVDYYKNGEVIAELNFGDGDCDNVANLTTGGETIEIELKDRMPAPKLDGFMGKGAKNGKRK